MEENGKFTVLTMPLGLALDDDSAAMFCGL